MTVSIGALSCLVCSKEIEKTDEIACTTEGKLVHLACNKIAEANEFSPTCPSCKRELAILDMVKMGENGEIVHQVCEKAGIINK